MSQVPQVEALLVFITTCGYTGARLGRCCQSELLISLSELLRHITIHVILKPNKEFIFTLYIYIHHHSISHGFMFCSCCVQSTSIWLRYVYDTNGLVWISKCMETYNDYCNEQIILRLPWGRSMSVIQIFIPRNPRDSQWHIPLFFCTFYSQHFTNDLTCSVFYFAVIELQSGDDSYAFNGPFYNGYASVNHCSLW